MKRPKAFVVWRKRAKQAEMQVQALEEAFLKATGITHYEWALFQFSKLATESPRSGIIFTNVHAPVV